MEETRLFMCIDELVLPIEPAEQMSEETKRTIGNRMIAYGEAIGKEDYQNGL